LKKASIMRHLLQRLWRDDRGALISVEYLFFSTIVIIGSIIGMANLRDAINVELTETANALMAISQGFTISGVSGTTAQTSGSQAIDTPTVAGDITLTPPAAPSVIDVQPPS
jgi:Flp pilus assembly pilin Flp